MLSTSVRYPPTVYICMQPIIIIATPIIYVMLLSILVYIYSLQGVGCKCCIHYISLILYEFGRQLIQHAALVEQILVKGRSINHINRLIYHCCVLET